MQAHSFFIGGLPMLFYGDEVGYTNDYSYLKDTGKSYDNRWMHRPVIDWQKNSSIDKIGTIEQRIFWGMQKLLNIRKMLPVVADHSNLTWLAPHNIHIAGFVRTSSEQNLFCLFNFSPYPAYLTWYAFKEKGKVSKKLYDHWLGKEYTVGEDHEYLMVDAYAFCLLESLQ